MMARHRWATTGTRVGVGAAVAAAAVVGVVLSVSLPWPTVAREPIAIEATPAPGASTVSCDGGLLVQGRDLLDTGAIQVDAVQTVTSGVLPDAPEPEVIQIAAPDVVIGGGPVAYTAPPSADSRTDIAATGSAVAASPDLTGFAASACRPPLMESWLVAGAGVTGASDFVVLSNPGAVVAQVQLTVFGATGPVIPPGGAEVLVAPGVQRVIPLSGLARGEASPVVRVNATGAPVQASLQSSVTRLLEPGGVDQSSAVVAPAPTQRILGIPVVEDENTEAGSPTLVRILSATSDAEATVTVRSLGDAEPVGTPFTVPLTAGVPTEVALGELAQGEYDVEVAATAPVVAAAWHTTGFGEGDDFAWHAPSPVIGVPTLVAVPGGPQATMTVLNSGDTEASVTVQRRDGVELVAFTLAPGETTAFPVARREVYRVDAGDASINAAVTMVGEGGLAGFSVWPADAAAPAITVFP